MLDGDNAIHRTIQDVIGLKSSLDEMLGQGNRRLGQQRRSITCSLLTVRFGIPPNRIRWITLHPPL